MSTDTNYAGIARRFSLLGGAEAFRLLGSLLRGKAAALYIGTAGVGLNTLYWTVAVFLSNVASAGLPFSSVAHLSEAFASPDAAAAPRAVARLRRAEWWLATLALALTTLLAPLFSVAYFGHTGHTLAFVALAVVVASLVVSGIELAVVKAARQTRRLAVASAESTVWVAAVAIACYATLGPRGILPALVVATTGSAAIALWHSHRTAPLRLEGEPRRVWLASLRPVWALGAVSLATTIASSGAELAIQSFLMSTATVAVVGLYRAGYQMGVGYVGVLFTAVAADYYPRLAAVATDAAARRRLVCRQSVVQLAFAAVAVVLFELTVPWLLPLLFSDEFAGAIPMARWAVVGTLFYALETPLGLMPAVLHRWRHYLLVELSGLVLLLAASVGGYACGGLEGLGVGLAAARALNFALVYGFCRVAYGFRYIAPSHNTSPTS